MEQNHTTLLVISFLLLIGCSICSGQTFRYYYLSQSGQVWPGPGTNNDRLQVAASARVSNENHLSAVLALSGIVRHMTGNVWRLVQQELTVGVFGKEDKLTVFPEYQAFTDRPECAGTCASQCRDTCFNGVKYDELPGFGGRRVAVVDDNLACNGDDPARGLENLLVRYFAESVHRNIIISEGDYFNRLLNAYEAAKSRNLWDRSSRAMVDVYTYFQEGSTTYFNVNRHPTNSGGMNRCGQVDIFCASELDAREFLLFRDAGLFDVMSYVWSNYTPFLPAEIEICA